MAADPRMVRPAEAARMLGMSVPTFYRRLADGTLARFGVREPNRLTRNRLFYAESVEAARDRKRVMR